MSRSGYHRFDFSNRFYLSLQKPMFDLLEGWLRHKSDMVNYEAARAICEMRNVTPQQLTRSIAGLFTRPTHSLSAQSEVYSSPTIVPFITKIYSQIRGYPYSFCTGSYSPYQCCGLQC